MLYSEGILLRKYEVLLDIFFFEKLTRGTCTSYLKSTVYGAKELSPVNRTYDSVFNLLFLQNMGVVLYNMGYAKTCDLHNLPLPKVQKFVNDMPPPRYRKPKVVLIGNSCI